MRAGTSERSQRDGRAFRELAAMSMGALGLPVSPRTKYHRDAEQVSDIMGGPLDRWLIRTRLQLGDKMSSAVDDAAARAKDAGRPFYAVIHRRNGRDPRQSYVTTDLQTFTALLAGQEQAVQTDAAKVRLQAATPPTRFP